MNIGFYRASLIGDNMVALYGIYAMKCLHPDATLIVYTNAYGINLYSQFHFIDVLIDVGEMSEKTLIEDINSRNFALLILTQSNRAACHIFKQTNIKRIITFMTRWSFAKQRFDTVYIPRFSIAYVPYVLRLPQYKRILKLVYHSINPPPPVVTYCINHQRLISHPLDYKAAQAIRRESQTSCISTTCKIAP